MKAGLLTILVLMTTHYAAQAAAPAHYDIIIQCDVNGPVYEGTLQIPSVVPCDKDYATRAYTIKVPIILSFNTFTYVITGYSLDFNQRCNMHDLSSFNEETTALEVRSGFRPVVEIASDGKGYIGRIKECSFRTTFKTPAPPAISDAPAPAVAPAR